MLLKKQDSKENDIKELKALLNLNLSQQQRFLIEREIYSIKTGKSNEEDSAYYINFYYKDSKNWVVIHDLRIELNGQSAQIDHILINRFFDIYVLESKNYRYGIKITEMGEFEAFYHGQYIGIPSPIEQNKRHIKLLSQLIEYYDLMPKRLQIKIKPKFFNYVIVSPKSIIKRPPNSKFDSSNIIKADTLNATIEKLIDDTKIIDAFTALGKMSSLDNVIEFGKSLISFHKPLNINWKKKFGILEKNLETPDKKYFCAKCKKKISYAEAKFCWNNKSKFKGKAYCYQCQKTII